MKFVTTPQYVQRLIQAVSSRGSARGALLVVVLTAWLFGLAPVEAFAFRTVPINLADMSAQAERIVVGVCTAKEVGQLVVTPGGHRLRFTQYTFQVLDNIKGSPGQTLTIRQVQLGRLAGSSGAGQSLERSPLPLPDYQPGQEVLLFLGPDSSLGLTSPVAMDQAVFDVAAQGGQKVFKNRAGNRFLFRNMSAKQFAVTHGLSSDEEALFSLKEGEPIPHAPFLSLIKKLAQRN